jgi:hypothetical protein
MKTDCTTGGYWRTPVTANGVNGYSVFGRHSSEFVHNGMPSFASRRPAVEIGIWRVRGTRLDILTVWRSILRQTLQ